MKSGSPHRFNMDRRDLLGAAALSAVVAGDAGSSLPTLAGLGSFETVPLWPGSPPGGPAPNLATRIVERSSDPAKFHLRAVSGVVRPVFSVVRAAAPNGSAMLIIPGGGYRELTIDTAFAAARRLADAGVTGFVLFYRLPHEGWRDGARVPLEDAMRAMRLLRGSAAQHDVDPRRIGVLGFSAGGHLASLLSLRSDAGAYAPVDAADRASARPLFAALLYPVITMLPPHAHEASREMLLGENPKLAAREAWSSERLVTRGTPPMFLAAAADDPDVPIENTLEMFSALRHAQVPAEMHVFERGGHGFGLGNPGEPLSAWPTLLLAWLRQFQLR
ncbi:MAG TPA: alpha/beta hydrolase [Rhizomicrobium sp.]